MSDDIFQEAITIGREQGRIHGLIEAHKAVLALAKLDQDNFNAYLLAAKEITKLIGETK